MLYMTSLSMPVWFFTIGVERSLEGVNANGWGEELESPEFAYAGFQSGRNEVGVKNRSSAVTDRVEVDCAASTRCQELGQALRCVVSSSLRRPIGAWAGCQLRTALHAAPDQGATQQSRNTFQCRIRRVVKKIACADRYGSLLNTLQ